MRKLFLFLVCIFVLIVIIVGCKNTTENQVEETMKNQINGTTKITIGYTTNSYLGIITNEEEIRNLENIFNTSKFTIYNKDIQQPFLSVTFYTEKNTISFDIDEKDVIKLENSFMKSDKLNFKDLYTIFNKYATEKK